MGICQHMSSVCSLSLHPNTPIALPELELLFGGSNHKITLNFASNYMSPAEELNKDLTDFAEG